MTHFTTLVLCNAGQDPEALLAPYEEYGAQGTITKYTVFEDATDEVLKGWEADIMPQIVMPDGRLLDPFDEEFRVPGTFGTTFSSNPERQSHRVPEHLERRDIPVKEFYGNDLFRYAQEYHGHRPHPTAPGCYGYYTNPRGYWDWYMLGGRWRGRFCEGKDVFPVSEWNGEVPMAVVTPDGEWHARGSVGWLGYVGQDGAKGEWEAKVRELLHAHPEATVYNFDLHT